MAIDLNNIDIQHKIKLEIIMANTLAMLSKQRVCVIAVHSVICAISYSSVEAGETVLYVTI